MSWRCDARKLWGDDFIAPMSEVLDLNRRTVQRWNLGEGEPAQRIQLELRRLASRTQAQALGRVLRRMANGERLEDIASDYRAHVSAAKIIEAERGRYSAIALLASKNELNAEEAE